MTQRDVSLWTRLALVPWMCCVAVASLPAADKSEKIGREQSIRQLSQTIDERIAARLNAEGVAAAPAADDAEFLRRVWLQLSRSIPPVSEVRRFLDDSSPDKRIRTVDQLLTRPAYVREFTTFWRKAWLPEAETATRAVCSTFDPK